MNQKPIWATFVEFMYFYFPFEFRPLVYHRNILRSNVIITNATIYTMTASILCEQDEYVHFINQLSFLLHLTHYNRDTAAWPVFDTDIMDRNTMTAFHTYQAYQYLNFLKEYMDRL